MAISLRFAVPPSDVDILDLSQRNPGLQFERSAVGELVVTPTASEGSRREAELVAQLCRWSKTDGRGVVFGPWVGFRLPDSSLLFPDAAWIRRERWEALTADQRDGFALLYPDAVFEIISCPEALVSKRAKIRAYLTNGAQLAVLIDPHRRAVEIYTPNNDPQTVEPPRSVQLEPVLGTFTLNLESIFS